MVSVIPSTHLQAFLTRSQFNLRLGLRWQVAPHREDDWSRAEILSALIRAMLALA